ncbi:hypothetical protein [Streptomyces sp. NPDC054863]
MVKNHARKNAARNRSREHAGENHRQCVDRVRHEEDPQGHRFHTLPVWQWNSDGDRMYKEDVALMASCTCGWRGADGVPGTDGKWGYSCIEAHPLTPWDRGEAEEGARDEWWQQHMCGVEGAIEEA